MKFGMSVKKYTPEVIKALLKENGIKFTAQRTKIIEVLMFKNCPMKAEEIYSALILKGQHICLSTIYRVLEVLEEKELITRHTLADGKANCFEMWKSEKSHCQSIICSDCRKNVRVEDFSIANIAAKLLETEGFEITEHNIQIYGKCKNCR